MSNHDVKETDKSNLHIECHCHCEYPNLPATSEHHGHPVAKTFLGLALVIVAAGAAVAITAAARPDVRERLMELSHK